MVTGLTDEELAVLTMYADGDIAHNIAHDLAVPVSAVRGIVHRACGFDRRRAANLVAHARGHHLHAVEEEPELPPQPEPQPSASVADFIALGITYRQLDYWSRHDYLHANAATPGTGVPRTWPLEELAVAGRLVRLLDAGLNLQAALTVARGQTEPAPGVHVLITDLEGQG